MYGLAAVHTTGVNFQGVLATVTGVTIVLTFLFAIAVWVGRSFFTSALAKALQPILDQLRELDRRVIVLEERATGRREALSELAAARGAAAD